MNTAGPLVWVVEWEAGMTTKNSEDDIDDCEDSTEELEASHTPSSTELETIHKPHIYEQSPYATYTSISELMIKVWENEKGSDAFKFYSFGIIRPFVS